MKETKEKLPVIPVSELVNEGVYFTQKDELVRIKSIDPEKKIIRMLNISDQYTMYVRFDRSTLVKRIR